MIFSKEAFLSGTLLLIDKPLEWTSFQAVNKVKWLIRKNFDISKIKVGHAGTLDPLATGLLLICTGKFTKKINDFQALHKQYTGTISLGSTTPSYDLETPIDQYYDTSHIEAQLLEEARLSFLGKQEQFPPVFSALKKDGKRLYEYARANQEVTVSAREITITDFDISFNQKTKIVDFKVDCSKGTYIRSLAYDFGKRLNSGAHLSSLRRTKIGEYDVSKALSLAEFESKVLVDSAIK